MAGSTAEKLLGEMGAAVVEMLDIIVNHLAENRLVERDLIAADLDHLQDELARRGVGETARTLVAAMAQRLRRGPGIPR